MSEITDTANFSQTMQTIIECGRMLYRENNYEAYLYDQFTSRNCDDFGAIYKDFPTMGKDEFIAKWKKFYSGSRPIEETYASILKTYNYELEAKRHLEELDKKYFSE